MRITDDFCVDKKGFVWSAGSFVWGWGCDWRDMLGQDILKNHREFEFATPRRVSREATRERDDGSNNNSIVSDAAMLKLMESVKNQIALFESTTKG
jgi:hypothetical protein